MNRVILVTAALTAKGKGRSSIAGLSIERPSDALPHVAGAVRLAEFARAGGGDRRELRHARDAAAIVLSPRRGAAAAEHDQRVQVALEVHGGSAARGTFPALMDRGRSIHRYQTFPSPADARRWLGEIYRRDRTEGQAYAIYLGVEKAASSRSCKSGSVTSGFPCSRSADTAVKPTSMMSPPMSGRMAARPYCCTAATSTRAARTSIGTSPHAPTVGSRCDVSH